MALKLWELTTAGKVIIQKEVEQMQPFCDMSSCVFSIHACCGNGLMCAIILSMETFIRKVKLNDRL